MKLDPTTSEFREAAHKAVDWIADYFDQIESYPVLSRAEPGDIARQFASAASEEGKPYDELFDEFVQKIVPRITHWNHPSFMASFRATSSHSGLLGGVLSR